MTIVYRVAHPKALLLYGCLGTGKTLLATALANHIGAACFDLSPVNIDTKLPGKDTQLLVSLVCFLII